MSTEENKAIVRRFLEGIFTRGNPYVVDELADPNFVVHDPSSEAGDVDAEGVKESIAWSHSAFPDLRVTIEDQVAEGSKVATRWRVRGTHRGEMMGAVSTGNQVPLREPRSTTSRAARSWRAGPTGTLWACCSRSAPFLCQRERQTGG
jgi:predicted ester cyclase